MRSGRDKVVVLGQACSAELASYCECSKPYPDRIDFGQPMVGVLKSGRPSALDAMTSEDRLDSWLTDFNRCIRCHGCRDVCPVCFCTECSIQHEELIPGKNSLPIHPST